MKQSMKQMIIHKSYPGPSQHDLREALNLVISDMSGEDSVPGACRMFAHGKFPKRLH